MTSFRWWFTVLKLQGISFYQFPWIGWRGTRCTFRWSNMESKWFKAIDHWPCWRQHPHTTSRTYSWGWQDFFLISSQVIKPLHLKAAWLMKPFLPKNMDHAELYFRARRDVFGIFINQCLISTLKQTRTHVDFILLTYVCFHTQMRIRYPDDQNVLLDNENEDHELITGVWPGETNLDDVHIRGSIFQTKASKEQRIYLKHFYSSPARSVP